ncbi:MAG: hypothetical protein C4542_07450 [Dehalococcoidia bacterium]|nr:MAG: hypothetical protein C4542_07450 [Dehalococcoidia bacterium]
MKILNIGDLHANWNWPYSRLDVNGLPTRVNDLLNVLGQVERILVGRDVETLVLGGDIFHRRHFISFRLYNAIYRALERLTERVVETIIVPGNHDFEDGVEHALYPLKHLPNTTLVEQAEQIDILGGVATFIPFHPDPAVMVKAFDAAESEFMVFSHYAAEGVELESDYWLEAPLKLGELGRFPRVFFNHVHKPSVQRNYRVVYVGAPMHFDFGDVGSRGGVLIDDHGYERVTFTAPVFVTSKWPKLPVAPPEGGYLRIVAVPKEKLEEAQHAAKGLGWLDAVPLPAEIVPEVEKSIMTALAGGQAISEELLRQRVRAKCPELSADEQAQMVELGMYLYRQASR